MSNQELTQAVDSESWERVFELLLQPVPEGSALSPHLQALLAQTALLAQLASGDMDGARTLTGMLPPAEWIAIYQHAEPTPYVLETLQSSSADAPQRLEALASLATRMPREEGGRVIVESLQKLAEHADDSALQTLCKGAAVGLCRLRYFSQAEHLAAPFDSGMDPVWECMAREQVRAGLLDAALDTLDRMRTTSSTSSLQVEILLQANRERDAVEFVNQYLGGGSEHLDRGWLRLSHNAWVAGRYEEATELADHIHEARLRTVARALSRSVLEGPAGLSGLFESLESDATGPRREVQFPAVVVEVCEPDSPLELRLLWHGTPHVVMAILAAKLARKGAIDSALALARQIPPGEFSRFGLQSVLKELCRLERMDEAFALLQDAAVTSEGPAYFGVALVRTGQTARAVELGRELPSKLQSALAPILAEMVQKQAWDGLKELLPLLSGQLSHIAELATTLIPLRTARATAIVNLLLPFGAASSQ